MLDLADTKSAIGPGVNSASLDTTVPTGILVTGGG